MKTTKHLSAGVSESDLSIHIRDKDPWYSLRSLTDARIALGRAGGSLPTSRVLEFQLAHAQAQDAVHFPLDYELLKDTLSPSFTDGLIVSSQATDRATYLQRPDRGRRLSESSQADLRSLRSEQGFDLSIVVIDGLSSQAVETNVAPFLESLLIELKTASESYDLAPLVIARQGRVALGDDVARCLNARCVLVLIGERPGLSSPNSLGLYLTWNPHLDSSDAHRNCISNIRPAGLGYAEAARRAMYLIAASRQRQLSGVDLKEAADESVLNLHEGPGNFLI